MNDDRAARAWRANKNRKSTRERPKLTNQQRIEFLDLIANIAAPSTFERKLGLSRADVEFYKNELNVEGSDDARRLARTLRLKGEREKEENIQAEIQKAREAETVAQARLEALEAKKLRELSEQKPRRVDRDEVKRQDAERQRRLEEQLSKVSEPEQEWRLPMEAGAGSEEEQIDRFRREIIYQGFAFLRKKYNVSPQQIKWEAKRLGLNIDWNIIRR